MTTPTTLPPTHYGPEPLDPTRPFLARDHILFGNHIIQTEQVDLAYQQLVEWTEAQPAGAVVGFTAEPTDCPCSRCLIDLGIAVVPEGYTLQVQTKNVVIESNDPAFFARAERAILPAYLMTVVDLIDELGVVVGDSGYSSMRKVQVTREGLLAILNNPEVRHDAHKKGTP